MASTIPLAAFTAKRATDSDSLPTSPLLLTSQELVYRDFRRKTLLSSSDAMIAFRNRTDKKACLACVQNSEECTEFDSGAGYRCTLCAKHSEPCSWMGDVLIPAIAEYFAISLQESVSLYEQWEDTIKASDNVDGNVWSEQEMEILIQYEVPQTPVAKNNATTGQKTNELGMPKRVPKPSDKVRAMTEAAANAAKKSQKRKRMTQERGSPSSKRPKSSPEKARLRVPAHQLSSSPTKVATHSPTEIPSPIDIPESSTTPTPQTDMAVPTSTPPRPLSSPPQTSPLQQIAGISDVGSLEERYSALQERYLKLCDILARNAIEAKLKDDTIQRLYEESLERERVARQEKADRVVVEIRLREETAELERKLQEAAEQSAAIEKWMKDENDELERRLREAMERSPADVSNALPCIQAPAPPAPAPNPVSVPPVIHGMQYGVPYGTVAFYANLERERQLREAAHNLAVSQGSVPMIQPGFNTYDVPQGGGRA